MKIQINIADPEQRAFALKGLTLKGKNRIQRGGVSWNCIRTSHKKGWLMQSTTNPKELFWLAHDDTDIEIVGWAYRGG